MLAKTLALLTQAFRVDVRQLRTHILRGSVALGVLWILFMVHSESRFSSAPGLEFFQVISWVSLVLISLAGAFYFPSLITEEKEQQTLGLLRMAGVGPATLLVGKSIGRLSVVMLLMAITLPYWWLAVTLGGVTAKQVAATAVILAAHLALMSQIGTLCSVIFRSTGPAAVASALAISALMFGPPILMEMLWQWRSPGGGSISAWFHDLGLWFAPMQLERALSSGFFGSVLGFETVVMAGLAAALFCVSWLVFDRFNTYEILEASGGWSWRSWLGRLPIPGLKAAGTGVRRKPRRAVGNAIRWKDFRQFAGGRRWWVIRGGFFAFILGFMVVMTFLFWEQSYYRSFERHVREMGAILMVWAMFVAGVELIYLSGQVFHRELKDQTWDSLRMLPMSLRALCAWKILGSVLALAPAFAAFGFGMLLDLHDVGEVIEEMFRHPLDVFFGIGYGVALTFYAVYLTCFFSLMTNPWLGIVLAGGTWFFTMFSQMFCCMGLMRMDRDNVAFIAFWGNSMILGVITLVLHIRIAKTLRGETSA
jgi:hypothetical protein